MLAEGGIPQGDYVPAPWLLSSAGWALWMETWGPGLELDLARRRARALPARRRRAPAAPHPLRPDTRRRLRHYLRLTGPPALLPEWGYGHWKSRDVYEHQRDVVDDFEGYERAACRSTRS